MLNMAYVLFVLINMHIYERKMYVLFRWIDEENKLLKL